MFSFSIKCYADTQNDGSYTPTVMEVCAARFMKEWYRARVDRIHLDGTFAVTYVDYGNSEDVKVSEIRKLDRKFVDIPMQVHKCQIKLLRSYKVHPRQKSLSESPKWENRFYYIYQQHKNIPAIDVY